MEKTIFDEIVAGKIKSWNIWEDDKFLAFLTPFPNTPWVTVVIPKTNIWDNIFSLEETEYLNLLSASKRVAKLLKKALNVSRVAMVVEGTGVAYVHVKLYPLYWEKASQTNVWSEETEFIEEYRGYITTIEWPRMSDNTLTEIQEKIVNTNIN